MATEFHEGLPGAGKSYEAVVFHIIPAIKERRTVVSNIRGLNVEKIAELSGQPLDLVRLLIINVEPAESESETTEIQRCINQMCDQSPENALIVWDEIQDYFPSGNYKLPHNQQKFWTEQRHRGFDIICMGQDRADCHKLIRNRIRTVIYFLKLEVIGKPNSYKWTIFQKQSFGKFVQTGSGRREYDKKYFGTYKSVRQESVKKKVYQTARTNMLANSKGLMYGVPFAFLAAFYAVFHLWGFFNPEPVARTAAVQVQKPVLVNPDPDFMLASPGAVPPPAPGAHPVVQAEPAVPPPIDYFDGLVQQYQVRAAGMITSDQPGKELLANIELLDSTYHIKERFNVQELRALGWSVTATGYGLLLEKQGLAYVARAWPIDIFGRVDQNTQKALGEPESAAQAASQGKRLPSGPTVTVIESGKPGHLW